MPSRGKHEPVEVYLVQPGEGRRPFSFEGAFEYLPPEAPLPEVGDLLLLPRNVTGDAKKQAFAWGSTSTSARRARSLSPRAPSPLVT
ncbi:MAG TPA: hypothetical protein VFD50_01635 [Thermoleophilia bacterium]|nr:hypothetical protein [Thermoleophilia bacterium]